MIVHTLPEETKVTSLLHDGESFFVTYVTIDDYENTEYENDDLPATSIKRLNSDKTFGPYYLVECRFVSTTDRLVLCVKPTIGSRWRALDVRRERFVRAGANYYYKPLVYGMVASDTHFAMTGKKLVLERRAVEFILGPTAAKDFKFRQGHRRLTKKETHCFLLAHRQGGHTTYTTAHPVDHLCFAPDGLTIATAGNNFVTVFDL